MLVTDASFRQNIDIKKIVGGAGMFKENLKSLRKNMGYTQEELANKLNVVGQTVSKWEKGYSIPDAEMVKRIAEILDTDISQLLGSPKEQNTDTDALAEQLSRISEQLVIKNRRSRRIWKTIGIVVLIAVLIQLLFAIMGIVVYHNYKNLDTYMEEYTQESVEE